MLKCIFVPMCVLGMCVGSVSGDGVRCANQPYLGQVDFAQWIPFANLDARAIEIVDGIAYVATRDEGVQMVDVSDPTNMVVLGKVLLMGEAHGLAVYKNGETVRVYIACGNRGVEIVHADNPAFPTQPDVSSIPVDDARDVALLTAEFDGQIKISIAGGADGLLSYDVTSEEPMHIETELGTGFARALDVQGVGENEFVYVAIGDGVDVYSVGDSSTNNLLTTIITPGVAQDVAHSGDVLYVAAGSDGVQAIELSADRTSGFIVDNVQLNFSARKVGVEGDRLYGIDYSDDVFVFDITDATSPNITGTVRVMGSGSCVVANGTELFIGTLDSSMIAVDARDMSAFSVDAELGSFSWGDGNISNPYRTQVIGNTAYVPRDTLEIFDVSGDVLSLIGSFDTGDAVVAVDVVESIAYTVDGVGLKLVDVSNSSAPVLIGMVYTPGTAVDVLVDDGKAYVADLNGGLQVIDVTNPALPTTIGSYDAKSDMIKVLFVGDSIFGRVAHVMAEESIDVVSLFDEATPAKLGPGVLFDRTTRFTAVSDGDHIYSLAQSAFRMRLRTHNLSNPLLPSNEAFSSAPAYLPRGGMAGVPDIELFDGVLSLTDRETGLVMFDVSDSSHIRFVGVFNEWGTGAQSWTTVGDRGYLRLDEEFRIFDMKDCQTACPADLNDDGVLNFFDVGDFLVAYAAEDSAADFDQNGEFNFFDVGDFLTAYAAGCP